ncbi:M14 family metallopeptidase [Bacillus benzoevorans]|uniref:G-D-glutamyl-meso-diaminopimelate peptidase n=1 Tax=Bacillus benzoevorans TaxID=1456 RepID=A0A7X0HQJ5_9BACI|nr:M14 family metallopeptidase [Bacillus benzoevorans]MBB6444916.1 g-D-glutamyl-meso-diaminopimelate peptidase [Bacillus benzoevorans]
MRVRVRSGDTLWYYSRLFLLPFNLILQSNPGINANALKIGQEIQIPGFAPVSYNIRKGDSLWKLAAARNLSVDALLLVNQNINPNRLMIGQMIQLPRRITAQDINPRVNYDYARLTRDIQVLREHFPFIRVRSIGESVQGKQLYEIRVGTGNKKVHLDASFHANEWITTPVLMSFLNTYLLGLTNSRQVRGIAMMPLYQSVDLSIVPMVNPDGVDLVQHGPPPALSEQILRMNKGSSDFSGWKANIRGVDLNNQFPANWEIEKERKEPKAPAPRDYPGDAPLTEPEAIAMADLARNERFNRMLAFHTQGKEFYWGYEGLEPPESGVLAREFARVSGYKAVRYIDSHAGYKDWFIQEFRRPGFTIELGEGVNPLPISQFDEIYHDALGIFLASLYM